MPWPMSPPPMTPMVCGFTLPPSRRAWRRALRPLNPPPAGGGWPTSRSDGGRVGVDHRNPTRLASRGTLPLRGRDKEEPRRPCKAASPRRVAAVHIHDLSGAKVGSGRQKIERHADEIFDLAQPAER